MSVNNWQQIEELFHDASQLQGAARAAFLGSRCNGDNAILQEVKSLLAASETDTEFLEQPSFDLGIKILAQSGSHEGRTIGHYRIIRLLGEGGMGEVYLAEDTKLERNVALKFLMSGLFDDELAKEQLMREARAVAKLEHPHICPVYSVESIGDHDFIVMPYIEGETLASLLRQRPTLDRVLEISEQIASALAAAHGRGIIHRDVKPQNVLIAEDGTAKILDFGLAKLVARTKNPASFDDRSTASQLGLIPGTVAYMSPEQVRGEKLDCTTDIFSFGIVLHEMLSGQNPFLHETREQTLQAIRNEELPALPRNIPATLTGIAQKCLQKDVARRYAVADDLLVELKKLRAVRAQKLASAWRPATKVLLAAALFLIVVGSVVGGLIWRQATRIHSLAILPITNETGDRNNDYLTDGMSPVLFNRLSDLPRLKLKLPTVVPSGKKDSVGRDLQVEAVLSGRILKNEQNGKPLLQLSLINTADGKITWERTFDPQTDIIALQDATALGVTSNLGIWFFGDEKKVLAHRPADNQEAFSAYLLGRQFLDLKRRNKESIQTALSYFDKSIDLDPSFAEAYSARADCYVLMTNVLYGPLPAGVAIDRALYNARKAIEINPLLADAHSSLGTIHLRHDWDWEAAEKEFKLAVELNPDYAPAHYWYANFLVLQRRFDESIRESETARRLDPYAPIYALNYGRALYYARRYDEAEAFFRTLLETTPDFEGYRHQLAYILFQKGKLDEAIDILQTLYKTNPAYAAAPLGYAYARVGKQSEAADMLRFLDQSTTPTNPNPAHEKLIIYIGMRDWERVFTYLDLSFNERFASVPFVVVDPFYDDLRGDARFAQLAERVHLAP